MIKKIERPCLHEIVVKRIVESISLGMYQKGEKLPSENSLCEQYGVSRITMRKALKELVSMGFIETRQGRGSVVTVSPDDPEISAHFSSSIRSMQYNFEYTMQTRLLIEPSLAASLAQSASNETLRTLAEKFEAGEKANDDLAPEFLESFHLLLAEALGNPLIYDFLGHLRLLENDAPSQSPSLPEKKSEFRGGNHCQHQKIMRAILSRQPEMAYLYMKEHILYLSGEFNDFFHENSI